MNHPFYDAVEADFAAVNQLIVESLTSHVPLVEEISSYLIDAGGKRLRPLLVLLAVVGPAMTAGLTLTLAIAIRFVHLIAAVIRRIPPDEAVSLAERFSNGPGMLVTLEA